MARCAIRPASPAICDTPGYDCMYIKQQTPRIPCRDSGVKRAYCPAGAKASGAGTITCPGKHGRLLFNQRNPDESVTFVSDFLIVSRNRWERLISGDRLGFGKLVFGVDEIAFHDVGG